MQIQKRENENLNQYQELLERISRRYVQKLERYRIKTAKKFRSLYADLVFYHRFLRCFVLIDLKIRDVKHDDIGQMNMYMGYFAKEENI